VQWEKLSFNSNTGRFLIADKDNETLSATKRAKQMFDLETFSLEKKNDAKVKTQLVCDRERPTTVKLD
jgi:hypothetical protein